MSGIEDWKTVDLVAQNPAGVYELIMVEERPWQNDPHQLLQFQKKLNVYVSFALDGQLVRNFPEAEGQPVAIVLSCFEQPLPDIADFLSRTAEAARRYGIDFRVKVHSPR